MACNYRDDLVLGTALAYWLEKRGARSMPSKRDIDPTEISAKILPNLQLIDVIDGGARFRYRLIGTATVDAYGEDFTGRYPDEMFPAELRDFIHGIYRRVCVSKAPSSSATGMSRQRALSWLRSGFTCRSPTTTPRPTIFLAC